MKISVKSPLLLEADEIDEALSKLKETTGVSDQLFNEIKREFNENDDLVSTFFTMILVDNDVVGLLGWLPIHQSDKPSHENEVFESIVLLPEAYKKIEGLLFRLHCHQYHQLEQIHEMFLNAVFVKILDSKEDRKSIKELEKIFHHSGWYGSGVYGRLIEVYKVGKVKKVRFTWPIKRYHKCYGLLTEFLEQVVFEGYDEY